MDAVMDVRAAKRERKITEHNWERGRFMRKDLWFWRSE